MSTAVGKPVDSNILQRFAIGLAFGPLPYKKTHCAKTDLGPRGKAHRRQPMIIVRFAVSDHRKFSPLFVTTNTTWSRDFSLWTNGHGKKNRQFDCQPQYGLYLHLYDVSRFLLTPLVPGVHSCPRLRQNNRFRPRFGPEREEARRQEIEKQERRQRFVRLGMSNVLCMCE